MSVQLELDTGDVAVAGTEVTINVADLPSALETDLNGGWILLKLASPVLLLAATAYQVAAKTSSATQVDLWCDGTADNLSRILVTTTTGAPAATDDLIISKEYTGAGTGNNFTVTMDNTATTDFGAAPTAANSLILPGIAICNGGTLSYGTTAATNYYLKVSNSVIVYRGGTFNIGTTGTPIPRDSTAVLEFDPAADGDYGLTVRNGGTFVAQGLSRTSAKLIVSCKLNTDEAANSTSLGVDTDTGWLDNDEIAVAATTRTASQTEAGTLNGAAGASTLTVDGFAGAGGGLANAHSGTSPTQAEVILLTRNVKIRSATSTVMAYVYTGATSTVDIDWVEFRYLGENAANKRGIEVANTNGSFNMQYSAVRDCEDWGVYFAAASGSTNTFSNNTLYRLDTAVGANTASVYFTNNGLVTFENNICLLMFSATLGGIEVAEVNTIFNGNTVVGGSATVASIRLNEGTTPGLVVNDRFSNNTVHSGAGAGVTFAINYYWVPASAYQARASIYNLKVWRCTGIGMTVSVVLRDIDIDSCLFFGNGTTNLSAVQLTNCIIRDTNFYADTSFATTNGLIIVTGTNLYLYNCNFGTASGIFTTHTNDINISKNTTNLYLLNMVLNNCNLSSSVELASQTSMFDGDYVGSQSTDKTAGLDKTWFRYGTITKETTTVHTGSQSMKMTPNSATVRLQSPSFKVAVASGATLTPTVYVYEDGSYNGQRARLIVKRNDSLGITADTLLDTATASSDAAWEGLTGTTAAATADGVMEFVVECDGTAGNLFVDSFTCA
jgi:hypothetical protein